MNDENGAHHWAFESGLGTVILESDIVGVRSTTWLTTGAL
jgi:hypothetical protein